MQPTRPDKQVLGDPQSGIRVRLPDDHHLIGTIDAARRGEAQLVVEPCFMLLDGRIQ